MTRLIVTPAAEQDMAEIILWYHSFQSGLELEFRLALDVAFEHIVRHPLIYTPVSRGMRRALLHRFPYSVFYRPQKDTISIVGIVHSSRHPRVWKSRSH